LNLFLLELIMNEMMPFLKRTPLLITLFFVLSCSVGEHDDADDEDLVEFFVTSKDVSAQEEIPEYDIVDGPIIFTEVDPINTEYKDHEGDDAGWVELYNRSSDTVNLKGYALTNSLRDSSKWIFGDVVIPPKSFMLVFLSGKNLPDYVAPHDSVNMIGSGCSVWTDAQYNPPGESISEPLDGKDNVCFSENGKKMFGARMRLGENKTLGWSSISNLIGTKSGDENDVVNISLNDELCFHAYITKNSKVSLRLAQTGVESHKGYKFELTGTGDSTTIYHMRLPVGESFPDLKRIYGFQISLENPERRETVVKVFSFIARNRGHEPHASFKIKNETGSLFLLNAQKKLVDYVVYPKMPIGRTWSLDVAAIDLKKRTLSWGYTANSPYKVSNSGSVGSISPSLDAYGQLPSSGFVSKAMNIRFNKNDYVRCETNGSAPSEESPLVTEVVVKKTTVLRCARFMPDSDPGEILNRTYIYEEQPKMPVVLISADPHSLFDPDSGIYMKGPNAEGKTPHYGANYWLDKEIPVLVEFFEQSANQPAFSKNAGFKIFGNYSRMQAKKSVAVTFREEYGDKHLDYPLFPDFPELKKFKSFLLRNNGNNFGNDYIRDRLSSSISEGLNIDYQRGRGVVVYYNGEYYGIHNIREKSSEHYFETHYDYSPDNIDLLLVDNSVSAGSSTEYVNLIEWMKSRDLSNDSIFTYVAERIDVDNYLNYVLLELFVNNRDWPANNVKKWRLKNPKTKWKWLAYDLDFGFKDHSDENVFAFATAENGPSWPNGPAYTFLLRKLLENESFRFSFINRMSVLLSMNFESGRVLAQIDELMSEVSSEISKDQERWNLNASVMEKQLQVIKEFAKKRPSVILSEMKEYFDLKPISPVILEASGGGVVLVNNLRLDESKINVNFFTGVPVTLSTECAKGRVWAGWSDGVMDAERTVLPEDISSLTAVFK